GIAEDFFKGKDLEFPLGQYTFYNLCPDSSKSFRVIDLFNKSAITHDEIVVTPHIRALYLYLFPGNLFSNNASAFRSLYSDIRLKEQLVENLGGYSASYREQCPILYFHLNTRVIPMAEKVFMKKEIVPSENRSDSFHRFQEIIQELNIQ